MQRTLHVLACKPIPASVMSLVVSSSVLAPRATLLSNPLFVHLL